MPTPEPSPRHRHYGAFYGLDPLPEDDRPFVTVMGNCQAESLRLLLESSGAIRSVRVPPVFEIEADELPLLQRLLDRTDVLLTQPVRDGYRDLPLGSAELAARVAPGARTVHFPTIRYAGLHPWQVVLRVPGEVDPPPVPYHDLRTLALAAGLEVHRGPLSHNGIREVRDSSVAILAEREQRSDAVPVSDLLVPAGADAAHVINHPGNPVLVGLGRRVAERLGLDAEVPEPTGTLLDEVHAPLLPEVLEALGLAVDPVAHWVYRGAVLPDEQVREVQLDWLRERPQVVEFGLDRHRETARLLGICP